MAVAIDEMNIAWKRVNSRRLLVGAESNIPAYRGRCDHRLFCRSRSSSWYDLCEQSCIRSSHRAAPTSTVRIVVVWRTAILAGCIYEQDMCLVHCTIFFILLVVKDYDYNVKVPPDRTIFPSSAPAVSPSHAPPSSGKAGLRLFQVDKADTTQSSTPGPRAMQLPQPLLAVKQSGHTPPVSDKNGRNAGLKFGCPMPANCCCC